MYTYTYMHACMHACKHAHKKTDLDVGRQACCPVTSFANLRIRMCICAYVWMVHDVCFVICALCVCVCMDTTLANLSICIRVHMYGC